MSDPFLVGFDLGTVRNGYCAGDGSKVPAVGAFMLSRIEDRRPICQLGEMGAQFQGEVMKVNRLFPHATHWISERPLLVSSDLRWTLERLYGLSCLLQTIGTKLGKVCAMVDPGTAKTEFAGRGASKDQMVAMAERLGIPLPIQVVDGREDIADSVAVWKVGIRLFARKHLAQWDGAVYRRRGGLL